MEFQYQPGRLWAEDGQGRPVAEILFPSQDGRAVITHTFVDPSLRGQGVAGQLVKAAADRIRAAGERAVPVCAYAVKWFEEHPEEGDLLRK